MRCKWAQTDLLSAMFYVGFKQILIESIWRDFAQLDLDMPPQHNTGRRQVYTAIAMCSSCYVQKGFLRFFGHV